MLELTPPTTNAVLAFIGVVLFLTGAGLVAWGLGLFDEPEPGAQP